MSRSQSGRPGPSADLNLERKTNRLPVDRKEFYEQLDLQRRNLECWIQATEKKLFQQEQSYLVQVKQLSRGLPFDDGCASGEYHYPNWDEESQGSAAGVGVGVSSAAAKQPGKPAKDSVDEASSDGAPAAQTGQFPISQMLLTRSSNSGVYHSLVTP
jgi:hypothetical protein